VTLRGASLVLLVIGLCSLAACRKEQPSPSRAATPPPAASNAKAREVASTPGTLLAPASPSTPRPLREQAVMGVLRGETPGERFPELATDDGKPVDPSLRDVLAPRQQIVENPSPRPPLDNL
jgi:hypothetical protein